MITNKNGFNEISYSGIGASPFSVIEQLDAKYPDLDKAGQS